MSKREVVASDTGFAINEWKNLSQSGKVCGIVGCLDWPVVRCGHCGNSYCGPHKFVLNTPAHQGYLSLGKSQDTKEN